MQIWGVIDGYGDSLYRTTDGGSTWVGALPNEWISGVSTPDSNTIIAVTSYPKLFHSNDGGKTWSEIDFVGANNANYISFVDPLHGVVLSSEGVSSITNDGGASWSQMKNASISNLSIYRAVSSAGTNTAYAVGSGGTIIKITDSCSQVLTLTVPPDGANHQILSQASPGHFSVTLQWNYPAYIFTAMTRVQAGMDSTFTTGLMLDDSLVQGNTLNNEIPFTNILPQKTYYWRVKVYFDDSTSTNWSDTWKFTTGSAMISGLVFNDDNADSVRDFGEAGLLNWRVDISGKIQESTYADSNGVYSFGGLDSGTYIVTQELQTEWRRTFPSFTSYVLTIGVNDSVTGIDFGNAYPWNSIEGTVYLDMNENGVRDIGEPGLGHWLVTLFGVDSNAVGQTDSLGHYKFKHVDPGTNTVALSVQSSFEQETPRYGQGYTYDVQTYGDQYGGFDFGVIKFPIRIKIPITIYDNSLVNRREHLVRNSSRCDTWNLGCRPDGNECRFFGSRI